MTASEKLDPNKPQAVTYCIPLWLRDEQIKIAIRKVSDRIQATDKLTDEPIAIVCFGPSLKKTWPQLRKFKKILTCSGAHKFLVEKGIIPTYHIDVDPREHKIKLMGEPHKDVQYLMASACHPNTWDHLKGYNVKLWHVFDGAEEAIRVLPRSEWAITGGSSVGLRGMTIARFLGYKNLHIFGMDGSAEEEKSHADEHPNAIKEFREVEYGGKTYRTTPALLECARQTWHELNQLKDCKARFYGKGLVQAMSKDYKREQIKKPFAMGVMRPDLISAEYKALNAELHATHPEYGVGGMRRVDMFMKLYGAIKPQSVLDYGCGKGYLAKHLPFPIWEYDPAIPGKDESPKPADMVVCTDVLEHVEPDKLVYVLDDLRRCIKKIGYFTIDTERSSKTLPDGRNTHLIVEKEEWWTKRLSKFFTIGKCQNTGRILHYVVGPQKAKKAA